MTGFRNNYRPADPALWRGRNDGDQADQQRWHQRILLKDLSVASLPGLKPGQKGTVVIGFCCDEGVRRNLGRTGSKGGPDAFRSACASLPVHFKEDKLLIDAGNICCDDGNLEAAQLALTSLVMEILDAGYHPLLIGGGHELAYPHYNAIKASNETVGLKSTIGVINFDAHFDLRKPDDLGVSSGTGFWQIAADCKESGGAFHYLPIGIQRHANTINLFAKAEELGTKFIAAEDFHVGRETRIMEQLQRFIDEIDVVYLSIDLDVFAAAYAPGVSAPAPVGLVPDAFFLRVLHFILGSEKLISIDIAELNPLFDQDNHTAKLAAWLAFQAI